MVFDAPIRDSSVEKIRSASDFSVFFSNQLCRIMVSMKMKKSTQDEDDSFAFDKSQFMKRIFYQYQSASTAHAFDRGDKSVKNKHSALS